MRPPTAEGIQLLIDGASLERRETGPIWGRVCFSTGERSFPDAGWTDIVVGFCLCWLHALQQLASKTTTAETVFFMDGPFRADMKLTSADSVELVLVDFHSPESVKHRSEERIATLLGNAVKCGESLLNATRQRDWVNDKDVQALRSEIGAAKALLRPGDGECNRDLDEAAGAADATACSRGGCFRVSKFFLPRMVTCCCAKTFHCNETRQSAWLRRQKWRNGH
jgi:hypothetical protein